MNTFRQVMHCDGCTSRTLFIRNILLLAAGKTAIDLQVIHLRPDLAQDWCWPLSWLNPFHLVAPWMEHQVPFIICLTTFLFFVSLVRNAVQRARDAGWPLWVALLTVVPFAGSGALIALTLPPHKKRSVWDIV